MFISLIACYLLIGSYIVGFLTTIILVYMLLGDASSDRILNTILAIGAGIIWPLVWIGLGIGALKQMYDDNKRRDLISQNDSGFI